MRRDQIILALDVPNQELALEWVARMSGKVGCFKVGLELFCAHGPELVKRVCDSGTPVFLDLKLHDIPNTVASAVAALNDLPVRFLTLHTQGGPEMIHAARASLPSSHPVQLLGVTMLTSLSDEDAHRLGYTRSASAQALHLAEMAAAVKLDGFVCSPHEASQIRQAVPNAQAIVTPGVRPAGSPKGGQARSATPEEAIANGATHIVIGRPVLQAKDPIAVVESLIDEPPRP